MIMTHDAGQSRDRKARTYSVDAGSVYHRPEPKPRLRDSTRRDMRKNTTGSSRRSIGGERAVLLSSIRTFTLVTLLLLMLAALTAYMIRWSWRTLDRRMQDRVGEPRPSTASPRRSAPAPGERIQMQVREQETPPRSLRAFPEATTGFPVGAPPEGVPPQFQAELDMEVIRRAVYLQKRAEALLADGNPAEAIERLHDALDIWPHFMPAWTQLGQAYLAMGQFARARIALERAAESDPSNPAIWNDLGVVLFYQNRMRDALEIFEMVADLEPNYPEAHFNRALCYLVRNDTERVEAALDAFLRMRPDDAHALRKKAYLQAGRQDYQAAYNSLQRALTTAPDWPPLYLDLAATAALLGRLQEAIRFLDEAKSLTSPDAVYQVYQQPAFQEIRFTEEGQRFQRELAERAREWLATREDGEDAPAFFALPMQSIYRDGGL